MKIKTIIRRALYSDLPFLILLSQELSHYRRIQYATLNRPFHKKILPESTITKRAVKKDLVFVVEIDKIVSGYVWGSVHQRKKYVLDKFAYVEELFVSHRVRNGGLGSMLLKKLFQEFKKQGCALVIAKTDAENVAAQKLYEKNGLRTTTVELWRKL